MKSNITLHVSSTVFKEATPAQMDALYENIMQDGKWESADNNSDVRLWMDFGTLMVRLPTILIGIEKDGYTHS